MFWVTDTERVIGDQHNQSCSLTMDEWKKRKEETESLNDRGWTHQGMSAYARKNRTSVLNRYWQRHISDKRPYGRCLHAAVAFGTFTYALTLMDKVEGWSDEKWIGPKCAACMSVYSKAVCNKKCRGEPCPDLDFCTRNNCGKCNLVD